MRMAVLGGTGALGQGLARRFAAAGHEVVIGSRDSDRAAASAAELAATLSPTAGHVTGAGNAEAAAGAEITVIAVPWEAHESTLTTCRDALAGKIVVDAVNPLGFDKQGPYLIAVPEGSAAQQAAALLPESRVTAAFHHLPAGALADAGVATIDTDTFVLGEDRDAVDTVIALAASIPGLRAFYAGRLRLAGVVEGMTGALIALNRRHHIHAGLRVTEL